MLKNEMLTADPKRQATDVIRAYSYQIYQSLFSWINLKDNQV